MKKIVLSLSGGMDSVTLLGVLLEQGYTVHCCTFCYGSKHNTWENRAAENVINFYLAKNMPVFNHPFDLSMIMQDFKSNLFQNQGEIPEGHYAEETMKVTVVPGRNLIFASIMAGFAESIKADAIALGVHSGDHHIYPDCRKEFVKALDTTIFLSSDKQVEVLAPFSNMDKADILKAGNSLLIPVPYHLTRTCYKNQQLACGKCGSCVERLEAFNKIGVEDPVEYEERIDEV